MLLLKSSDLVALSLKIIIFYNCLAFNSTGVHCQAVSLDPLGTGNITTCTDKGLIASQDRYIFRGKLNASGTTWEKVPNFEIKRTGSSDFDLLCSVSVLICSNVPIQRCYCASNTGDIYELVANISANVSDSNADIRLQWADPITMVAVNSSSLKIPHIFDLNSVSTDLTVNNKSETCPVSISQDSVFVLKCLNSPSPCKITLRVANNISVQNEDISYTIKADDNNTSILLNYSFSACGLKDRNFVCSVNIQKVNGTTTATTVPATSIISSSTVATAVLTGTLSCKAWGIGFSVIYYINILAIIGTWTAILTCTALYPEKKKVIHGCIGGLCFSGAFDISLIIAFALGEPCTCDPCPNSDMLPLWQIMMIIFLICVGIFCIATVVVMLRRKHDPKVNSTATSEPVPRDPPQSSPVSQTKEHKSKSNQKRKDLLKEDIFLAKYTKDFDLGQNYKSAAKVQSETTTNSTANEDGDPKDVKKKKKKKKSKKEQIEKNENEGKVNSTKKKHHVAQNKVEPKENTDLIHPSAPKGPQNLLISSEINYNPYNTKK